MKGRRALVTGGGRGIGLAIADRLVSEGADVIILGRNEEALASASKALGCRSLAIDLRRTADFAAALGDIGSIDILVNNAGVAIAAPFAKQSVAELEEMIAINLTPAFIAASVLLPAMVKKGWGRIINIASTGGLKGYSYSSSYCVAKHGLIGLTRALAAEYATSGVTVNAVCPGFTDTEMARGTADLIASRGGRSSEEVLAQLSQYNPQHRLIAPEEVAQTVAFLCGEQARSFNGQSLVVAGGEIM